MELHLHLNVFMGGLFLSASHRLEGKIGSGAQAANVVVGLTALHVDAVKPNWESGMNQSVGCLQSAAQISCNQRFSVFGEREDKFVPWQ